MPGTGQLPWGPGPSRPSAAPSRAQVPQSTVLQPQPHVPVPRVGHLAEEGAAGLLSRAGESCKVCENPSEPLQQLRLHSLATRLALLCVLCSLISAGQ